MRARVCGEMHACKGFIFFDGCAQQFFEERMCARVGISPGCATYMTDVYNPFNQAVRYTFVKRDALLAMQLRTEPATTPATMFVELRVLIRISNSYLELFSFVLRAVLIRISNRNRYRVCTRMCEDL